VPTPEPPSLAAGLAPRYVDVLLLELRGWGDDEVASCLGIDPAAVPNLRRLAHCKLEQLLG
jgi:transcriptional regulator